VAAGAVAGAATWAAVRPLLARPAFARANYRGHVLPTAGGIALPVAVVAVEAVRAVVGGAGLRPRTDLARRSRRLALAATAGYAALGAVDDLAGTAEHRGFQGHLRALAAGRPTTGALKLVGGGVLGLGLAAGAGGRPRTPAAWAGVAADGLLVALAANLGNLLDRAPGRTTKAAALAFSPLAAAAMPAAVAGPAVVVGAGLGLLRPDLREQVMLGDAGANPLGAAVGLAIVLGTRRPVRLAALGLVAALNAASERVSFSAVIDRTPALRALDRAGARPEREALP
jgi:UDP-N-acetylmuramyl pentapeptide phosphotransferase/UDP-N-acetylglucosamine-1-phosphate transferase